MWWLDVACGCWATDRDRLESEEWFPLSGLPLRPKPSLATVFLPNCVVRARSLEIRNVVNATLRANSFFLRYLLTASETRDLDVMAENCLVTRLITDADKIRYVGVWKRVTRLG